MSNIVFLHLYPYTLPNVRITQNLEIKIIAYNPRTCRLSEWNTRRKTYSANQIIII